MAGIDDQLAKVATVVVEDRVLRRIIKRHRRIRGLGLQVPHARCYTLPRADLLKLVDPRELGVEVDALPPDRVVVIAGARDALVAGDPGAWSRAWRAIFHGRIHQAFDDLIALGQLPLGAIRERVNRIGQTEFDEIRFVLRQEELLLPPADDTTTYIEFVALYLELEQFEPRTLARTFPTLHDTEHVDATIALDIDAAGLLAASRPSGAPEHPLIDPPASDAVQTGVTRAAPIDPSALAAAGIARARGNLTRAAICSARAGDLEAARRDLDALCVRLSAALDGATTDGWTDALLPVVKFAATQRVVRFSPGARLLYDLQAACVVAEREVKVVDVASWVLSLGRRPIVRTLPATREVRVAKHLHIAANKIALAGLSGGTDDRERLAIAIHTMVERADHDVRTVLRPKIEAAFDAVALRPRHLPERVAQKKIIDELLDQAVSVGRLSLGNLRDAMSHNDLKLPDLRVVQLATGDQLLRCDRALAHSLDGVYRRGEIYLRFLQKLSSVLFGTAIGRVVTMYLLLPVLGSFVLLEGLQHVIGPLMHLTLDIHPRIATRESFIAVGVAIFLLIHAPPFRRGVGLVLRAFGLGLRTILWDAPLAVWRLPIVRHVRDSRFARWIIRPAIPAAIAYPLVEWQIAAGIFVAVALISNSRAGRLAEELVTDWTVRSTRHLLRLILPGLIKYVLELFVELVELLDRAIYRVDEWLRFKSGQSRVTLVIKGVLGTLWFFVAYFLRAYVNLFVEPVINPIKHFPTVTVAAKLTLPFSPSMIHAIRHPMSRVVGKTLAGSFAAFTVFVIPGLAGFLVWELKENWKLYLATRSPMLRAVSIGHHGETMATLLTPGFHSGTIPKLFTKLRRATWKGDERGIAKHREGIHHVEDAIFKFADRELVSMLNEAKSFRATDVAVIEVELGSNRVEIELACPSVATEPAELTFEQQSGWLIASIREPGWISRLDREQREVFEIALAGFYKFSGVDFVRQQLEDVVGADAYDVSAEGLVVWPGAGYETEVVYDLRSRSLAPIMRGARYDGAPPVLAGRRALYGREDLAWSTWTAVWEQLANGGASTVVVVGPSLLRNISSHVVLA